eukprot:5758891-Prymnesium_polylepis.1
MQMLSLQDESVKFTLQCLKDMREEFEGDAAAEQPDGGGAGEMAGQVCTHGHNPRATRHAPCPCPCPVCHVHVHVYLRACVLACSMPT